MASRLDPTRHFYYIPIMNEDLDRRFCVAPMMDCTDRHERYFLRLISRHAVLYSEMVTAAAILHGDLQRLLSFDPAEHPVALQLGGSDPGDLAAAARIGADHGYDEINLNVGCPSDRVQSGRFGACLMAEPDLVGACVASMAEAVAVPVTVKTRIGIDDQDSYEALYGFVETVSEQGCRTFILHARKAWLQGLSPKQNREVPPLRYEVVHRLKEDFPNLEILINGGISTIEDAEAQLTVVDGVMVGRSAYENPYLLSEVDGRIYGDDRESRSRPEVVEAFTGYAQEQMASGVKLHQMTRHITGLFSGMPGARKWRRHLTEGAVREDAQASLIQEAASFVTEQAEAA
jgi:tRNA-dihydrouridine synthase A